MILRASYGTLGLLGLVKGNLPPQRTAYFMLDGRCVFDCAFCTHARSARSDSSLLSRVVWKIVDPIFAAERLKKIEGVKRVCLQVVSYRGYVEDTLEMIGLFKFKPVSVSVRATSIEEVREYFKAGADMVGISIDVASRELHPKIRGGRLEDVLKLLDEASKEFPGRITTHIIVGMGETDRELIDLFFWLAERNITIALFAFTPLKGTKMEKHPRPPLKRYRKIQLARWLIQNGMVKEDSFVFDDEGNLVDIVFDFSKVDYKKAFLTSGCPDCTRPYYNESPGKELYNVHDESLLEDLEGIV